MLWVRQCNSDSVNIVYVHVLSLILFNTVYTLPCICTCTVYSTVCIPRLDKQLSNRCKKSIQGLIRVHICTGTYRRLDGLLEIKLITTDKQNYICTNSLSALFVDCWFDPHVMSVVNGWPVVLGSLGHSRLLASAPNDSPPPLLLLLLPPAAVSIIDWPVTESG